MNADGNWVSKGPGLDELMTWYFNEIFISNPGDVEPVLNCFEGRTSYAQNRSLLRRVGHEEVKNAVFSMHMDKSPGPDGLSTGFYQAF